MMDLLSCSRLFFTAPAKKDDSDTHRTTASKGLFHIVRCGVECVLVNFNCKHQVSYLTAKTSTYFAKKFRKI